MDFSRFGLSAPLEASIVASGYTTPTPIQDQAIPVVLSGRDVIGLAQTGTGKTAAFVLPILEGILARPRKSLRVLVLVPTRELAEQVLSVFQAFSEGTGIRSIAVYGGVSINEQIRKIRNGTHIIVACPGRLLDHLRQRTLTLEKIETLVLDEADQLFEHGFLPDVRRIISHTPRDRQTLLFSATMPREIQGLASETLRDPVEVRAGGEQAPAPTVDHGLMAVDQEQKTNLLVDLLGENGVGSVLIFTRTKHRAERLAKQLDRSGFSTTTLQGNLSQNRRLRSINGFRSGEYQILVATDIAARGIDVANVTHVINYDIPETPEAYTHRIGRTGRASQHGEAITFVSREDARQLRLIEKTIGSTIPERATEGFVPAFVIDRNARFDGAAPAGRGSAGRGSAGRGRPGGSRPNGGRSNRDGGNGGRTSSGRSNGSRSSGGQRSDGQQGGGERRSDASRQRTRRGDSGGQRGPRENQDRLGAAG